MLTLIGLLLPFPPIFPFLRTTLLADKDWVGLVAVLDLVSETVVMFAAAGEKLIRLKPEALGASLTWVSSGELSRFLRI